MVHVNKYQLGKTLNEKKRKKYFYGVRIQLTENTPLQPRQAKSRGRLAQMGECRLTNPAIRVWFSKMGIISCSGRHVLDLDLFKLFFDEHLCWRKMWISTLPNKLAPMMLALRGADAFKHYEKSTKQLYKMNSSNLRMTFSYSPRTGRASIAI